MSFLRVAAKALDGDVSGTKILCPGPHHSRKDRSLVVSFDPDFNENTNPQAFITHSYCGDDWRDCRRYVIERLGLGHGAFSNTPKIKNDKADVSDTRRAFVIKTARETFAESVSIKGTLAERYLTEWRGLGDIVSDNLHHSIRFHPRCRFGGKDDGRYAPAMVCAMRDFKGSIEAAINSLESDGIEAIINADRSLITGIHRTELDPVTAKRIDKKMLGKGGSIFIATPYLIAAHQKITLTEGIEDALSALKMGLPCPVAAGSSSQVTSIPVLDYILEANFIPDNDENEASFKAFGQANINWNNAGKKTTVHLLPWEHKDLNDYINGKVR